MEDTHQFDFLKMFIEKTLDDAGFEAMSEETRGQYVPQFMAEAEKRLGIALMPKLTEESAVELKQLVEKGDVTQAEMQAFWKNNVADFDMIVQKTLTDFAEELKDVLKSIS